MDQYHLAIESRMAHRTGTALNLADLHGAVWHCRYGSRGRTDHLDEMTDAWPRVRYFITRHTWLSTQIEPQEARSVRLRGYIGTHGPFG